MSKNSNSHKGPSRLVGSSLVLLIILADQATKAYFRGTFYEGQRYPVLPYLDFTLVYNKGFAFGLFPQGGALYALIAAIVIIAIFTLWQTFTPTLKIITAILAGGAAGNLIDRVIFGQVTDWIAVQGFSVFNIADATITIAAIGLILVELTRKEKKQNNGTRTKTKTKVIEKQQ